MSDEWKKFPNPNDDPAQAGEWLLFAEDVFEAFNPSVDILAVLKQVQ